MRVRNRFLQSTRLLTTLLGLSLCTSLIAPALATVPEEEPGLEITPAKTSSQTLQISEVPTTAPYMAGQNAEILRPKMVAVASYIQNRNRKLALGEISNIAQAIVQYSERYGVDYRLLTSLIAIESAFRRDAISSSGAIGMGQLKPTTARWLGVVDPYDPVDNIAGTARFLGWLMHKYNGNLEYTLAAYYQGPGYVDRNGVNSVCMPYLQKVNQALSGLL